MEICHEERKFLMFILYYWSLFVINLIVFAPVMTVIKSKSTDDSISLANSTRFGLGAAVFGNDKNECRYVSENLKCGMVRWVIYY